MSIRQLAMYSNTSFHQNFRLKTACFFDDFLVKISEKLSVYAAL